MIPIIQRKILRHAKKARTKQSTDKRKAIHRTRDDPYVGPYYSEFKIAVTNILKTLAGKVVNMHEQILNFSGDMQTIRKSQMEILKKKKIHKNRNKECPQLSLQETQCS